MVLPACLSYLVPVWWVSADAGDHNFQHWCCYPCFFGMISAQYQLVCAALKAAALPLSAQNHLLWCGCRPFFLWWMVGELGAVSYCLGVFWKCVAVVLFLGRVAKWSAVAGWCFCFGPSVPRIFLMLSHVLEHRVVGCSCSPMAKGSFFGFGEK